MRTHSPLLRGVTQEEESEEQSRLDGGGGYVSHRVGQFLVNTVYAKSAEEMDLEHKEAESTVKRLANHLALSAAEGLLRKKRRRTMAPSPPAIYAV